MTTWKRIFALAISYALVACFAISYAFVVVCGFAYLVVCRVLRIAPAQYPPRDPR